MVSHNKKDFVRNWVREYFSALRHRCLGRHTIPAKQLIYIIIIIMSVKRISTELFHDATSKSSPLKFGPASSASVYCDLQYFHFVSRDRATQLSLPTACVLQEFVPLTIRQTVYLTLNGAWPPSFQSRCFPVSESC